MHDSNSIDGSKEGISRHIAGSASACPAAYPARLATTKLPTTVRPGEGKHGSPSASLPRTQLTL